MKSAKRVFSTLFKAKNWLFFLVSTLFILGLNLYPMYVYIKIRQPQGRTYYYIHNNVQDFFFYQALMNQGGQGDFLTSDPYTTETHQPSIIFSYFVLLGKLAKTLNIPYAIMYHIARIIFGFGTFLTAYLLIRMLKTPHPNLTYLFFLFASPLMHTVALTEKIDQVPLMYWWTGMDAIRRAAYLPHHMFGSMFLVLSIIFIIRYVNKSSRLTFGALILFFLLLSYVHTPSLFILIISLPVAVTVFTLLKNLQDNKLRKFKIPKFSLSFIGLVVTGGVFLLIMLSQTQKGFPWSQYIEWEKNLQFPLDKELFGALGILFPLSLLGLVYALLSLKFENILVSSWFFAPFLLIPFAKMLNISNIRLIQGVPYLPLAILASWGLAFIKSLISTFIFRTGDSSGRAPTRAAAKTWSKHTVGVTKNRTHKLLSFGINVVVLIIFAYFSIPALSWGIKDQQKEYWPIFGNVYFDNRLFDAFKFIDSYFPKKSVAVSTFYSGNYLPAFTHTRSFIGHFGYTYNYKEKELQAWKFFEGKMTDQEAKDFILGNKIDLVFQGPEEKPIYTAGYLYPNVLKIIYDKEEATIYVLK